MCLYIYNSDVIGYIRHEYVKYTVSSLDHRGICLIGLYAVIVDSSSQ